MGQTQKFQKYTPEYIGLKTRELVREQYESKRRKMSKNRKLCIEYFSNGTNSCKCCGINNIKFLTLSHPNGDGWVHRIMSQKDVVGRLIKCGFETKFDIVVECYNCNLAREVNGGKCPHEVDYES